MKRLEVYKFVKQRFVYIYVFPMLCEAALNEAFSCSLYGSCYIQVQIL